MSRLSELETVSVDCDWPTAATDGLWPPYVPFTLTFPIISTQSRALHMQAERPASADRAWVAITSKKAPGSQLQALLRKERGGDLLNTPNGWKILLLDSNCSVTITAILNKPWAWMWRFSFTTFDSYDCQAAVQGFCCEALLRPSDPMPLGQGSKEETQENLLCTCWTPVKREQEGRKQKLHYSPLMFSWHSGCIIN